MEKELFARVITYVYNIVWDDVELFRKPCPFSSYQEAFKAYNKHQERILSRKGPTLDDLIRQRIESQRKIRALKRRWPRVKPVE